MKHIVYNFEKLSANMSTLYVGINRQCLQNKCNNVKNLSENLYCNGESVKF